jgi:hypothetical protein
MRARKMAEYGSRLLDEVTRICFALSVVLPAIPTHQSTKIATQPTDTEWSGGFDLLAYLKTTPNRS